MAIFVISVKRIRDYHGNLLSEEKQKYEYAMIDCHGPMASGYPCFAYDEYHAEKFTSIEDAKKWWNSNKRYLTHPYLDENKFDMTTLAIRKHITIYKTVEKLRINFGEENE